MTFTITVQNYGTLDAILDSIDISNSGSYVIIYGIEGIQQGTRLLAGESKTFTITTEFDINAESMPLDLVKELTVTLNYIQDDGQSLTPSDPDIDNNDTGQPTLVNAILRDNTPQSDASIDFSQISSATNGQGLYYTSTNTEDNKVTYYFRGAVENNYVQFGTYRQKYSKYRGYYSSTSTSYTEYDTLEECTSSNYNYNCTEQVYANVGDSMYWRIIRINEDGSVRLIYQGTTPTATIDAATITNSTFNDRRNDNAYVGYMYGTPGSSTYEATHADLNDSTIKTIVDEWYENNLLNYEEYLADPGFCGDRSLASSSGLWNSNDTALGYGDNITYYGVENRLYNNKTPQFACPQNNDLYTTGSSTKGNKALEYPIGLITADEVAYAGGVFEVPNTNYYLYTGGWYRTMSPRYFPTSGASEWYVYSNGYLRSGHVNDNQGGVRPVINLKFNTEITSGNGTSSNPYVIN